MAGSQLSAPKELRARWYLQVEKNGRTISEVCSISRKTYHKWYNHERPHLGKEMDGMTPYQKYLSFCPQG